MDSVTKVLIEMISGEDYTVSISAGDDGRSIVRAVHNETAETIVVRDATVYEAACELAQQIGIVLNDG